MKIRIWHIALSCLLVLVLSGCLGAVREVSRPAQAPAIPVENGATPSTAVITLLPVQTVTPPAGAAATGTPTAFSAQATATSTLQTGSEQPAIDFAAAIPAFTSSAPGILTWQDCSLAGGWTGCSPDALEIPMRVGFYDPGSASVVSLALDSATAWSVPVQGGNGISPRVSISKDGSRMLMALDETLYAIYEADGTPLGSFPLAETGEQPVWQPDGSLAFGNCVHSIEGARACLTLSPELLWQLTVVLTPGADEAVINFEPQPSDRLFRLITFIPGRMTVVGQSYFAGNQAMMQGAQLFTYDLISAERRDLDLMMALGWRAAFTWSPVEAANLPLTLALGDTTGWSADQPALALYNEDSGAINHPLPEGVSVGHMDWNPVSGNLAVSAVLQGEAVSPFNDPGIYSLDPASGVATSLTHPPAGARDGLPRFTKDGKTLLFTRWFESGALEVRSIRADGSDEALILSGLNAECPLDGPACEWQRWIDYQPY